MQSASRIQTNTHQAARSALASKNVNTFTPSSIDSASTFDMKHSSISFTASASASHARNGITPTPSPFAEPRARFGRAIYQEEGRLLAAAQHCGGHGYSISPSPAPYVPATAATQPSSSLSASSANHLSTAPNTIPRITIEDDPLDILLASPPPPLRAHQHEDQCQDEEEEEDGERKQPTDYHQRHPPHHHSKNSNRGGLCSTSNVFKPIANGRGGKTHATLGAWGAAFAPIRMSGAEGSSDPTTVEGRGGFFASSSSLPPSSSSLAAAVSAASSASPSPGRPSPSPPNPNLPSTHATVTRMMMAPSTTTLGAMAFFNTRQQDARDAATTSSNIIDKSFNQWINISERRAVSDLLHSTDGVDKLHQQSLLNSPMRSKAAFSPTAASRQNHHQQKMREVSETSVRVASQSLVRMAATTAAAKARGGNDTSARLVAAAVTTTRSARCLSSSLLFTRGSAQNNIKSESVALTPNNRQSAQRQQSLRGRGSTPQRVMGATPTTKTTRSSSAAFGRTLPSPSSMSSIKEKKKEEGLATPLLVRKILPSGGGSIIANQSIASQRYLSRTAASAQKEKGAVGAGAASTTAMSAKTPLQPRTTTRATSPSTSVAVRVMMGPSNKLTAAAVATASTSAAAMACDGSYALARGEKEEKKSARLENVNIRSQRYGWACPVCGVMITHHSNTIMAHHSSDQNSIAVETEPPLNELFAHTIACLVRRRALESFLSRDAFGGAMVGGRSWGVVEATDAVEQLVEGVHRRLIAVSRGARRHAPSSTSLRTTPQQQQQEDGAATGGGKREGGDGNGRDSASPDPNPAMLHQTHGGGGEGVRRQLPSYVSHALRLSAIREEYNTIALLTAAESSGVVCPMGRGGDGGGCCKEGGMISLRLPLSEGPHFQEEGDGVVTTDISSRNTSRGSTDAAALLLPLQFFGSEALKGKLNALRIQQSTRRRDHHSRHEEEEEEERGTHDHWSHVHIASTPALSQPPSLLPPASAELLPLIHHALECWHCTISIVVDRAMAPPPPPSTNTRGTAAKAITNRSLSVTFREVCEWALARSEGGGGSASLPHVALSIACRDLLAYCEHVSSYLCPSSSHHDSSSSSSWTEATLYRPTRGGFDAANAASLFTLAGATALPPSLSLLRFFEPRLLLARRGGGTLQHQHTTCNTTVHRDPAVPF